MESYVRQLLKDADLTVVTKKHVRMKYKEHVGRELIPEEKSKINDMVYAFVKELSAAVQQDSTTVDKPVTTPNSKSKDESPSNKENKQSNQKPSTFIIKGQVVDRNSLYRSKSKDKMKTVPDVKQTGDKDRQPNDAASKTRPEKTVPTKEQATAAKLRINEVMSAVLGPDKGESSSEVSSVSSLTDTSLSEEEEEAGEHINEALEKLKAARDKKIQMSLEKKKKINQQGKGNIKARRSLAMEDTTLKEQDVSEDSEAISIISVSSVISETPADTAAEKTIIDKKKNSVKQLMKRDSDSGELTVKRTPKRYDKRKELTAKLVDSSVKKKKLVKRKGKKVEDRSESDTESEEETPVKLKEMKQKKKSRVNKKGVDIYDDMDTDSENETLDKIAAKKNMKKTSDKEKPETRRKKKESTRRSSSVVSEEEHDSSTGDTPLAKKKHTKSEKDSDSEASTGDTPLAKKKHKKLEKVSDSEGSTGDTPLVKKKHEKLEKGSDSEDNTGDPPLVSKKRKKHIVLETDSESETCDTTSVKKRFEKAKGNVNKNEKEIGKITKPKNSIKGKILSTSTEESKKSSDTKNKLNESKSESSSGDTPLAQLKKTKKAISKSVNTEDTTARGKDSKVEKSLGYNSDASTGDTPLKNKQEHITENKMESESDVSTGDTPLIKKKRLKESDDGMTDEKSTQKGKSSVKSLESYMTEVKDKSENKNNSLVKQSSQESKIKNETGSSVKRKRKLSESSNISAGDASNTKNGKKCRLENSAGKEEDSELRDERTGNTAVVGKKFTLRSDKKNMHLDSSGTKSGKKPQKSDEVNASDSQYSDTCENEESIIEISSATQEEDENCDKTIDNDSPLKVVRGQRKTLTRLESSSEEESTRSSKGNKRSTRKKPTRGGQVNGTSSQSDQVSDDAPSDPDADSDDSDDVPLAQFKQPVKTKVYDLSSDSEDDIPLSKTKAAQGKHDDKNAKDKKEPSGPMSDVAYVRLLRQICRECQMFVRNDRELAGCNTDRDKIEKMEQMLKNVGMKGKPSLKKAEEVKLMKEAKELSADNIISSETGRVMRKVKSIWARRTISPVKPAKSKGGDAFAGLKDIVDSEGTESG